MRRVLLTLALLPSLLVILAQPAHAQDPAQEPAPAPQPAPPPPPPPPQAPPPGYPPPQPYPPGYPPPPPGYAAPYGYPPVYPLPQYPGYQKHDGFFLRMQLGGGAIAFNSADTDEKFSGGGMSIRVALGGALSPNLILFGEILSDVAPNPSYRMGNIDFETRDFMVSTTAFGPGVAYYFQPSNVFISGTAAAFKITAQNTSTNKEADMTDTGFGMALSIGKEWWISADWALGAAAQVFMGSAPIVNTPNDERMTARSFMVAFSATYN